MESTLKRIGHKHGDDVCGNYGSANIDEKCIACIETQIYDFTRLKMNYEKYRLNSFKKIYNEENAKNIEIFANKGFWLWANDKLICNFCENKKPIDLLFIPFHIFSEIEDVHWCPKTDIKHKKNIPL